MEFNVTFLTGCESSSLCLGHSERKPSQPGLT